MGGGGVLGSSPNNVTQETSTSTFYLPKCVCVCVGGGGGKGPRKGSSVWIFKLASKKTLGGGVIHPNPLDPPLPPPPCTCTCALLKKTQTRHSSIWVSLVSAGRGPKHKLTFTLQEVEQLPTVNSWAIWCIKPEHLEGPLNFIMLKSEGWAVVYIHCELQIFFLKMEKRGYS